MKKNLPFLLMMAMLSGGCSDNNGSSEKSNTPCENNPLLCSDGFADDGAGFEDGSSIALPINPTIPVPKKPTFPKDENNGGKDPNDDAGSSGKKGAPLPNDTDADEDGVSVEFGDCDDSDPDVYPGSNVPEVSGGKDYNCDKHLDAFIGVIFVDDKASVIAPDGSFNKPFSDIAKAIEAASNKKKIVRFYEGTYDKINLTINTKVTLEGGYYCEDDDGNSVEPAQCPSEFNIKREVFETDIANICKANERLSRLIGTKDGAAITLIADATVDGFYIESPADNGYLGAINITNSIPVIKNNIIKAIPKNGEAYNTGITYYSELDHDWNGVNISNNHIISGDPSKTQIVNAPGQNIGLALSIFKTGIASVDNNCIEMGPSAASTALSVYGKIDVLVDFPMITLKNNHIKMKPSESSFGILINGIYDASIIRNHFTLETSATSIAVRGMVMQNMALSGLISTNLLVLGKDNKIKKNNAFVFENTDYKLYSNTVVQGESDFTTSINLEGDTQGQLVNNIFSVPQSTPAVFYYTGGKNTLNIFKNNLFDANYLYILLTDKPGINDTWAEFKSDYNSSDSKENNLHDNPQLGSNYKPAMQSPAIEAGYDPESDTGNPVPDFPKLDILGKPLSDPPTIGCFQI